MFSNDYKDSKEGVMNDISKEGFEEFLHFIYTGEVNKLDQHGKELLVIADKYELDDLKTACELFLMTNLNDDLAIGIFESAHKFRCSADLKKASFDYIKKWVDRQTFHVTSVLNIF